MLMLAGLAFVMSCRAYGQGTSSASEHVARRLVPIPLTHDNLAKGTNHSQYHSFLPVSTSHMLGGKVHMEELSAPVAVVQQALKGLVDGQLGELAALCQEATVREQKLAQLRLEHSQLAQKAYEKTVGNK